MADYGISNNEATAFIESLGVPRPNRKFKELFYERDIMTKKHIPRYTKDDMKKIFETGNYPQLAKEYKQAKDENRSNDAHKIFLKAAHHLHEFSNSRARLDIFHHVAGGTTRLAV